MNLIKLIISEVVGLFIDDEFLAIGIVALVAVALALTTWLQVPGLWVGLLIVVGCPVLVAASIYKLVRAKRAA